MAVVHQVGSWDTSSDRKRPQEKVVKFMLDDVVGLALLRSLQEEYLSLVMEPQIASEGLRLEMSGAISNHVMAEYMDCLRLSEDPMKVWTVKAGSDTRRIQMQSMTYLEDFPEFESRDRELSSSYCFISLQPNRYYLSLARQTLNALPDTPRKRHADEYLSKLEHELSSIPLSCAVDLEVYDSEDIGTLTVEWIMDDRRLGFVFEDDLEESTWFVVFRDLSRTSRSGRVDDPGLDVRSLVEEFAAEFIAVA